MYTLPNVGDTVTVITRYPNYSAYSNNSSVEYTYSNARVLDSERWFTDKQFKITSDEPHMRFRVITLDNVSYLEINGKEGMMDNSSNTLVVEISGSKGKKYSVVVKDGHGVSCTCPGFQFRGKCKHLSLAREKCITWQLTI